jgi:hypothetical protein
VTNAAAAALIADRLPRGLIHPGDGDKQPPKLIPLPGLSNMGITPEQAEHFARQAGLPANDAPKLIGEAIVCLLETKWELVDRDELAQLRAAVATPAEVSPAAPMVHIICRHNRAPLFQVSANRAQHMIDCDAIKAKIDEVHS